RQYWEWMSTKSMREEQNFATTGVAADNKIRDQYQKPESHVFSTTESIERWFRDETVLAAGAYNFMTMSASEVEDIFEMNKDRVITNFGNPKQIRNARADNEYHSHAWATSMMVLPWSWLSVTPRMRLETTQRSGNSSYPSDTTAGAPDGIINNTEISQSQDKMTRMGEGISFRVTKIPRTALYNEFEFEQARNWLGEDRDSLRGQSAPSTGEIFTRESLNLASRGIWTLGGQYAVCRFADFTTQFRINRNNSDYDNTRHTDPSSSSARSAFYDVLNTQTEEFSTHLLLKPKRWLRPSVRYKVQARDYMTRVMDQSEVTTEMDSHIFTFDLSLQPRPNLLIVTGLSPQYAWISSPARSGPSVSIPRYQSNILTWLFNVNYGLTKKINLLSNLGFSKADNFNDFSSEGLPLGTAYSQVDFSAGVAYAFTEAVSVETDYSFFGYHPDERYDSSHYNASMIGIKTKVTWA
ncbi:MAG: hypothetical protein KBC91_03245, partial [Candidatus Omnitrophica bacterium]|nr:hypothetical protein [Candidatus Omnitrophota bacterium]